LPTLTPRPTPVPPPPPPGLPVQLVIPRIRVNTPVIELSTALDARGVPQWETVPFVAGHYRVTGLVGAPTNVVLSGHVLTRDMGNVFRDLHLLRPGDPIVVYTEQGEFTYQVADLRLVPPTDTSPLTPSATPRLTLITCAGEYDFRAQSFTERLIVAADLVT
jgi:LPXTG-site transpeptidase (sortase) family protein